MALFVLAADFNLTGTILRAGKVLDDKFYPIAAMQTAGAIIYPATTQVLAKAQLVVAQQLKGAADALFFNVDKINLPVIQVLVSAPLTTTGGQQPTLGIVPATTLVPGSMSAADKAALTRFTAAAVTITTLAIDWSLSTVFTKSINVNSSFTFANSADGETIVVRIVDTNGSTVTWPAVKWHAATPPVQTVSSTDVYTFVNVGGTIYGSVVQDMR